jgi:hypothetical protein
MKNKKNHIKVNLLNKNNHKHNYCNIWGPTGAQSLSPEATPGVLPGSNCIAIVWQLSGNCLAIVWQIFLQKANFPYIL